MIAKFSCQAVLLLVRVDPVAHPRAQAPDLSQAMLHVPSPLCLPLVGHVEEPVAHDAVDVDFAAFCRVAGLDPNECSGWRGRGVHRECHFVREQSGDGLSPGRQHPGRCKQTPCGISCWWKMRSCRARSQRCVLVRPSDIPCLSGGQLRPTDKAMVKKLRWTAPVSEWKDFRVITRQMVNHEYQRRDPNSAKQSIVNSLPENIHITLRSKKICPKQWRHFSGKQSCLTTLYAAHFPFGFLRLNDTTSQHQTAHKNITQHCHEAVGTSNRAVARGFPSQPQSLLCAHPSVAVARPQKTLSSTVVIRLCSSAAPPKTPRHPQQNSPSRRDRPSRCPPRHRGHPARGSSGPSQSQWQPRALSLRRVAHCRSCAPLRPLPGSRRDQRTGHPSTSSNTYDLAALKCATTKKAGALWATRLPGRRLFERPSLLDWWSNAICSTRRMLPRLFEFQSLWLSDQTWSHHLATFEKVMATPAVSPGLFEYLTTLTFRAQHRNHIVSTAFWTRCKQKQRLERLVVHMRSAIHHDLSRIQPKLEAARLSVGVDKLTGVSWKKVISRPWRFSKKGICRQLTPKGIFLYNTFYSCTEHFCQWKKVAEQMTTEVINSKNMKSALRQICNHFRQDGNGLTTN